MAISLYAPPTEGGSQGREMMVMSQLLTIVAELGHVARQMVVIHDASERGVLYSV